MEWVPRGYGGNRPSPESIKQEGWRAQGVPVIKVDDERLTWPERELIRQLGKRLYGDRPKEEGTRNA